MYTYSAGSPGTFGCSVGHGGFGGFGAVTHAQAQAQAAIDFAKQFGHPAPPRNLTEANWLSERTTALKAVAGTEQAVVTRQVRIPANILGPIRVREIMAAMNRVGHPGIKAQFASALSSAQSMTEAGVQRAEQLYYQAKATADNAGYPVAHLSAGMRTVRSGGGVPSAASGTASVLKNLSESLASIFTRGGTPVGPMPQPQPVGGTPFPFTPGPVQTSAGPSLLQQRVGPLTVGQIAIGGGGVLAAFALMRNIIPLAIVGAAAAGGAWFMGRRG